MLRSDIHAVILAGGSGSRFWPKSRALRPKQLCQIGHPDKTMIEATLDRLDGLIPPERRVLVTHVDQLALTRSICGARVGTYLAEPSRRDTANALALAALYIESSHGGPSVMLSVHSDHVIEPVAAFHQTVATAVRGADLGKLVLIGAKPTRAETGFGYLELGTVESQGIYKVSTFKEKPSRELAEQYLAAQNYLWNTGIFCWRTDVVLDELRARLPNSIELLQQLVAQGGTSLAKLSEKSFSQIYDKLPRISIDHAVLEVSDSVVAVPSTFDWHDLGSWLALAEYLPRDASGNTKSGEGLLLDCRNTLIDGDGNQFVAAIGLRDVAIVTTKDALLVCALDHAQEVKKVVQTLEEQGRGALL